MSISFICKNLSQSFYDKFNSFDNIEDKYKLLTNAKESGLNIVSCIGSHGLLRENIDFNLARKNGAKFTKVSQSKGTSKKQ
jgi:hypothetical protein